MAHEFIARNGLIAEGSVQAQTSVTASNGYQGFLYDSASYALKALSALSSISASYAGTSVSASHAINTDTSSYISQSIGFPTAINGYFPYYSGNTLTTSSLLSTDGIKLYGPFNAASSSISASYASTIPAQINVTGITSSVVMASQYEFTNSYATVLGAGYTISNADNGKVICFTGSTNTTVTLTTSSIDGGWSAMFFQSGSGRVLFTTASISTVMRNRSSFTGSAGQYALVSCLRVPSGDFILGGDMASS